MHLETLQLYCEVVRRQSFTRGAAECGVTQSAASQAIRQLEDDIGVLLIDRSKRPFAVTPEGERFYRACRSLLHGFERVRADLTRRRRAIAGVVRVAAIYSVGLHEMGTHMQRFRQRYPEARVRMECLHPEAVVRSVREDAADIGILSYPPSLRGFSVVPLREEPMVLVCPPGHPLARRGRARLADLAREPFVAFDENLAVRKDIDRELRRAGVRPRVAMEFDNIESIKQAVSLGTGVSILPEPAIQKELAMKTLVAVPLEGAPLARPIGLIHRSGKRLSATAGLFIEMLKEG